GTPLYIDIFTIVEQGPNQYIAAGSKVQWGMDASDFAYRAYLAQIRPPIKTGARLGSLYSMHSAKATNQGSYAHPSEITSLAGHSRVCMWPMRDDEFIVEEE
ncbi:MAG: hypothetical protein M1457_03750, partial [bacterium]|nr:hypothetical protein [bacterium]